jgi:lambda repressor-like predicted transcriptional regulator
MPGHFSRPGDGRPPPAGPAARDHVRQLRDHGGTFRSIARAAGLGAATVHDLLTRRRRPAPATVAAVLAVRASFLTPQRVDAGGTRLRLRALHVMGHGSARIARALGTREMTIRRIVRGDSPTVSPALRDAVADLYDAWWDRRAPERSKAEHAAATAARRRAIAGNWCAGAGLDDDRLDTQGYKPAAKWKPATGTGTAPDINPPARNKKTKRRTSNPSPAARGSGTGEQSWR